MKGGENIIKTNRNVILLALLAGILLSSSIGIVSGQAQPQLTDLYTPAGIYEVSISAPNSVNSGDVFDVAVTVTVTGFNESAALYNFTVTEGIESISVSFVEAGITLEKRPFVAMITNTNVSLFQPTPVYVINVTSVEQVFMFNSSFLDPGTYSIYVSIKGFRLVMAGLAIGSFSFYLEDEATVSITGTTAPERVDELLEEVGQLSSTIDDLRQELTTVTITLYASIAIAAIGVVIGAAGFFLARRRP